MKYSAVNKQNGKIVIFNNENDEQITINDCDLSNLVDVLTNMMASSFASSYAHRRMAYYFDEEKDCYKSLYLNAKPE